jgi:hypothetical protein
MQTPRHAQRGITCAYVHNASWVNVMKLKEYIKVNVLKTGTTAFFLYSEPATRITPPGRRLEVPFVGSMTIQGMRSKGIDIEVPK